MLVCLDVDGCLIDSDRPMMAALNEALTSLGLPEVSLAEVRPHLGPPLITTLTGLLRVLDADTDLASVLARRYRRVYARTSVAEATTYPGIDGCLQRLADAGNRLVVVSSKPPRFARPVLQAVGQLDRFAGVYGPMGAETEPKAGTLARAVGDHAGCAAVMVGDTVEDVEAARVNSLRSIAVSWGYGDPAALAASRPDALIGSPEELPATVASVLHNSLPGRSWERTVNRRTGWDAGASGGRSLA